MQFLSPRNLGKIAMAINYGPTDRDNPFSDILKVLGPMTHVASVSKEEIDSYRGYLPDGLLKFWLDHGRGALLGGYAWICDPALLRPVLEVIFDKDPEYRASDFSIYMYSFDGKLSGWGPKYNRISIDLTGFRADCIIDGQGIRKDINGIPMSSDFLVGHIIRGQLYALDHDREIDNDYFTPALKQLGSLNPGEIYGYFPSQRMGGSGEVETMRTTPIREHLLFLAQLERIPLRRYIYDPKRPDEPLGRLENVRLLGPE